MNQPADIIKELESDNSRLFKESVISREILNDNSEFLDGVRYICDRLITFGVKQIPERSGDDGVGYPWESFKNNLERLSKREITGNAARDMIEEMMNQSTNHQWNNWYRRILLKDLKCGVNTQTINNCVKKVKKPEYLVPVFSCQLAQDSRNRLEFMSGKKLLSEKLDGTRVISILYPDGTVDQFSRNGKELLNFVVIKEQLSIIARKLKKPIVLDGEVMSSSFQALMTQLYRKDDVQTNDSNLHLFDMLSLDEFKVGYSSINQNIRTTELEDLIDEDLPNVKIVSNKYVDLSTEQGKIEFDIFYKECVENGLEGIMIKDPDAPYECKRTSSWLKLKPQCTIDLTVLDLEEGNDKYTGKLGAMICQGEEEGKVVDVRVGSGFSDEQRELYWNNKEDLIGKIVEIKYDVITQNQNGGYSLRFPVFIRLRGFENGEKL
nr:MAG: DNA ligase [Caudoviricetes sp.]